MNQYWLDRARAGCPGQVHELAVVGEPLRCYCCEHAAKKMQEAWNLALQAAADAVVTRCGPDRREVAQASIAALTDGAPTCTPGGNTAE